MTKQETNKHFPKGFVALVELSGYKPRAHYVGHRIKFSIDLENTLLTVPKHLGGPIYAKTIEFFGLKFSIVGDERLHRYYE